MQTVSMLMAKGIWQKIVDFFLGFFAFLPQSIYFLYASMASLLDVLQYLVRKLAGLDVYYVNGEAQGGDIITDFLKGIVGIDKSSAYSAISTVFWSLVIFGVILLVLTSIVSIIKAHYNYDANKSNPFTILRGALKSLATMVIVPIVSIFGVYLAQIVLMTLDQITSPTASSAISSTYTADAANEFACDDDGVYTNYDYFSAGGYTKTPTFSGMLFKVAAYDCNRVRSGYYSATTSASSDEWDTAGVFYTASGTANAHEVVAAQIDYAFVNNLKLKNTYDEISYGSESDSLKMSLRFGLSATFSAGLHNVKSFSKFNVGLVFYYYDLWAFNSILGFAGVAMALLTLGNVVFGLMGRLIQVVALFVVYPAFIGIMPLDDGGAFGKWRKQFTSDILMAFGAVVGMNIFFLILPYFNNLSFFNNVFLDGIANMIIILSGLTLVKKFIGLISSAVGGGDANETGSGIKSETANAAMKGVSGTLKAAGPGAKIIGNRVRAGFNGAKAGAKAAGKGAYSVGKKLHEVDEQNKNKKAYNKKLKKEGLDKKKWSEMTEAEIAEGAAKRAGDKQARKTAKVDKKIRSNFGLSEGAEVTDQQREAWNNLQKLDRTERKEILKDINLDEDADGRQRLRLYSELGVSKGALSGASQKKWEGHLKTSTDRRVDKANKKEENRFKRAKFVGKLFGQDTSGYTQGSATVDDNGNIQVKKGTGMLRGFGQASLDVGEAALRAAKGLSGFDAAWKKLADGGVIDDAKTALQQLSGIKPTGDHFKSLRTGKQKTDQDNEELKAMRKAQLEEQKNIAKKTEETTEAIKKLTTEVQKLKGSGGSGSGSSGSGGSGGTTT